MCDQLRTRTAHAPRAPIPGTRARYGVTIAYMCTWQARYGVEIPHALKTHGN